MRIAFENRCRQSLEDLELRVWHIEKIYSKICPIMKVRSSAMPWIGRKHDTDLLIVESADYVYDAHLI